VVTIRPAGTAVVIDVRVVPRSGRSGIAGTRDGALLVRLNAPPVEGAANAELVEIIARVLRVPKRAVSIASGERSRQKRVRVEGVTEANAAAALRASREGPASLTRRRV
jgi:uncharacterized protein (TIGR00251 family)